MNYKILTFKDNDFSLDVCASPEEKTFWLTQEDIAILFNKTQSVISRHIQNLCINNCINKDTSMQKMHKCFQEENAKSRLIKHYNLDAVLAIGKQLKSNRGLLLKEFADSCFEGSFIDYKPNIIIYNNGTISLDVNVSPEEETVWLNQTQMAALFETTKQNISTHIFNVIKEGELEDRCVKENLTVLPVVKESLTTDSTHKKFLYDVGDGRQYYVDFYNLDMILAVGYRVKSKRAIEFRRWASSVLKQYLLKGYAINENRVTVSNDNYIQLMNRISNIERRMEKIEEEPAKERLFFNGEYFDAREFISSLITKAIKSVLLIDPCFDIKGLSFLEKCNKDINKIVVLSKQSSLSDEDVESFQKQYGELTIIKRNKFHDRFLIIDEKECYSLGTSLNYLGNKIFAVIKIEDDVIIESLLNKVK